MQPQHYFIEANLSGDKKASTQSFHTVRGKKVTAEAYLEAELVRKFLHTTPEQMVKLWYMTALGGVLSGTIGVQGHYANGLAALYLACGQDVACVAESAVGVTRLELTHSGDLYVAVTLPNLMVGTIGGGTALPSQKSCLEILGLAGAGKAQALAEVCAALALAGELSIRLLSKLPKAQIRVLFQLVVFLPFGQYLGNMAQKARRQPIEKIISNMDH